MNTSNEQLVDGMTASGILHSSQIVDAFRAIDRKDFVVENDPLMIYRDAPLPIGYGQTISQPSTVAFMLELLGPKSGEKILDVGSGSGWTVVLLGQIVGNSGSVDGVEIIPELLAFGRENSGKYTLPWTHIHKAGNTYGYAENAPYDKILVSAAGDELPRELVVQLRIGGKMVIPIENDIILLTRENEEDVMIKKYHGFSFVPLIAP